MTREGCVRWWTARRPDVTELKVPEGVISPPDGALAPWTNQPMSLTGPRPLETLVTSWSHVVPPLLVPLK